MPRAKKTHDDYRQLFCLFCWRKGDQSLPKYVAGKKTDVSNFIEKHLIPSYLEHQSILPGGYCRLCRGIISEHIKKDKDPKLPAPKLPVPKEKKDYDALIKILQNLPPLTRQNTSCNCFICNTMKGLPVHVPRMQPPPRPELPPQLNPPRPAQNPGGRPRISTEFQPDASKGNRKEKVDELMQNTSPKTRLMLARATIKEEQEKKGSSSPVRLPQASGGPSTPCIMGKGAFNKVVQSTQPKMQLSHETLLKMQVNHPLSNKALLGIAQTIREDCGRKSVQPGLQQKLPDSTKSVAQFFASKTLDFEIREEKGKDYVMKPKTFVFCTHVSAFLTFVMEHRGKGITKILLGSDGGQGSFKITCNLVEEGGATRSGKYLDSGVKKALVLVFCEGIPETYFNVKTLRKELQLSTLNEKVETVDLKMLLILCGMMGSSCTHPCPYCLARHIFQTGQWDKGELRTLGMLKKHAAEFAHHFEQVKARCPFKTDKQNLETAKKDAKNYYNVINPPLIDGNDEDLILDLLPIPEYHVFEGCVNNIVKVLNEVWSQLVSTKDRFFMLLAKNKIHRLEYRN